MVAAAAVRAGGRAERGHGVARRRWLRPVRLLRIGHRHPDVRPPRRPRAALQQLPHDSAVLAHPSVPVDRTQSPRQRDGAHRRVLLRLPRLRRDDPAQQRLPLGDPPPARLRHVRCRQVAPRAGAGDGDGRDPGAVAARPWLRTVLRLHGWRDRPVPPRSRARQPSDRPAALARGGIPPHRGPRRPLHRLHQGPPGDVRGPAVPPLSGTRRVSRAAPGAEPVPGSLPRALRPGLGSMAGGGLRPPTGKWPSPGGHGAQRAASVDRLVGLAR